MVVFPVLSFILFACCLISLAKILHNGSLIVCKFSLQELSELDTVKFKFLFISIPTGGKYFCVGKFVVVVIIKVKKNKFCAWQTPCSFCWYSNSKYIHWSTRNGYPMLTSLEGKITSQA